MRTNIQNNRRPVIGITMGDPVGVGPEIILIGLRDPGSLWAAIRAAVIQVKNMGVSERK